MTVASDKKSTAAAEGKKVKAVHAAQGKPLAGTEDPTDHSTGAKSAKSAEEVKAEAEVDQSIVGKIQRSELFAVNDHPNGGGLYIGISPQNDPNASDASKRLSSVSPLSSVPPRTGMVVKMKDGTQFAIADGFGPDSTAADWQRVALPSGELLFA